MSSPDERDDYWRGPITFSYSPDELVAATRVAVVWIPSPWQRDGFLHPASVLSILRLEPSHRAPEEQPPERHLVLYLHCLFK
ncbi:hypothetical protein TNCT_275631 [Trichonephila clavata]|uniref:Uncharacterized protein n=1 Tax=Trichonephila clavata TaxID=2740835 RepID=A0A8X6GJ90_TRICU|nr:hypothetical protein TNCT_275631 [Trichonephila clavata]